MNKAPRIRSTTVLTVRRNGQVAMGADGQVTLGDCVMKGDATKLRRLAGGNVLCGFAGGAADAFALLERFDGNPDLKRALRIPKKRPRDRGDIAVVSPYRNRDVGIVDGERVAEIATRHEDVAPRTAEQNIATLLRVDLVVTW